MLQAVRDETGFRDFDFWMGRWTVHNRRDNPLPSDDITTLAAAGSGMWVGTRDAGAVAWRSPELAARAFLPVAWR